MRADWFSICWLHDNYVEEPCYGRSTVLVLKECSIAFAGGNDEAVCIAWWSATVHCLVARIGSDQFRSTVGVEIFAQSKYLAGFNLDDKRTFCEMI